MVKRVSRECREKITTACLDVLNDSIEAELGHHDPAMMNEETLDNDGNIIIGRDPRTMYESDIIRRVIIDFDGAPVSPASFTIQRREASEGE